MFGAIRRRLPRRRNDHSKNRLLRSLLKLATSSILTAPLRLIQVCRETAPYLLNAYNWLRHSLHTQLAKRFPRLAAKATPRKGRHRVGRLAARRARIMKLIFRR